MHHPTTAFSGVRSTPFPLMYTSSSSFLSFRPRNYHRNLNPPSSSSNVELSFLHIPSNRPPQDLRVLSTASPPVSQVSTVPLLFSLLSPFPPPPNPHYRPNNCYADVHSSISPSALLPAQPSPNHQHRPANPFFDARSLPFRFDVNNLPALFL